MTLGAYDNKVLISDRAGLHVGMLRAREVSQGEWNRIDSDVSDASATFTAATAKLTDLEPWLHHVTMYRGPEDEVVWRGVVYTTAVQGNQVSITARDPSVYFDRRRIAQRRTYFQTDVSRIAAELITDAMVIDDPFEVAQRMIVVDTGIYVTRTCEQDARMISEELKDLVEAGLRWTFNAGRLLIGPVAKEHMTAAISDRDVDAQMTITKDGGDTITDAMIVGKTVTGTFFDYESQVGVLQVIEKQDAVSEQASVWDAARRIVRSRSVTPRRISLPGDSRLRATAAVEVGELIVGTMVPVKSDSTGIVVNQLMRLSATNGKFSAGQDDISVTLVEPETELQPQELVPPDTGYEVSK